MGKIYAGTSDGLYESATGTSFIRYDIGHVNAIAEDGNGIIWCGTKTGLKKMNGKNVTTYKKSNSTLPHDDVLCLTRDSKGAVWAGTVQGVAELSDAGVVKVYTGSYYEPLMSGGLVVRPGNTAMEGNTISKIIFMGEGEAFVGTNRGLNRTIGFTSFKHFSGDSQEPSKMPDGSLGYKKQAGNSPLLANFIRALEFSPEGKLLIGTRPGISIFDPTTEEWSSITKGELEFPGGAVNVIRSAGKGYFVGTDNGLFQMQTIVRKVPVK
jgi:ligand-binding sensor domain-containing protein